MTTIPIKDTYYELKYINEYNISIFGNLQLSSEDRKQDQATNIYININGVVEYCKSCTNRGLCDIKIVNDFLNRYAKYTSYHNGRRKETL